MPLTSGYLWNKKQCSQETEFHIRVFTALSDPGGCALSSWSQNLLFSHRSECRADSTSQPSYPVETDVAIWTNILVRLWHHLGFYLKTHAHTAPNSVQEFYEKYVVVYTGQEQE